MFNKWLFLFPVSHFHLNHSLQSVCILIVHISNKYIDLWISKLSFLNSLGSFWGLRTLYSWMWQLMGGMVAQCSCHSTTASNFDQNPKNPCTFLHLSEDAVSGFHTLNSIYIFLHEYLRNLCRTKHDLGFLLLRVVHRQQPFELNTFIIQKLSLISVPVTYFMSKWLLHSFIANI